jgi:tetratricopeptide (TPR) repeat protein
VRRAAILLVLLAAGCGTYSPLDSHYNRGVEFYDQGRLADAIREYQLALEEDPENYRARYNLAVALHDQGKKEDAPQATADQIAMSNLMRGIHF